MNWARLLSLACAWMALAVPAGSRAAIESSESPELFLVLWDPVTRVSYTKDLGINLYTGPDAAQRERSFFVYAQQDIGYQQFWTLDTSTDPNYLQFRTLVTDTSNLVWSVLAFDAETGPNDLSPTQPGAYEAFVTLRPTSAAGQIGSAYAKLSALLNIDFGNQAPAMFNDFIAPLNQAAAAAPGTINPFNSHRPTTSYDINGSSVDVDGQLGYFGKTGFALPTFGASCQCELTNRVGTSSWFYRVTGSDEFDGFSPVSIDEFDNLANDGYWGLAVDPSSGRLVLSYTLAPATLQSLATTAVGRQRAVLTEYLAGNASRIVDAPSGEFAGYVMPVVTAVPEPHAIVLLLLGGAVVAGAHRPRRRG